MSLKSTSGTSLTEVMVMMVILSMAIVGIYGMVNSGRQLALLTDTRLKAINIAREGLESVATLRDTFALKGFEPGQCGTTGPNAFLSINEEILTDNPDINCPQTGENYILEDTKTLLISPNTNVCVNEFGWYSQEFSARGGKTLVECRGPMSPPECISCAAATNVSCGGNVTQSCKTRFQRKITFENCSGLAATSHCIKAFSKVWWGTDENDPDTSLTLNQIITRLN